MRHPLPPALPGSLHWNDTLTGLRGMAALWVFGFHLFLAAPPRRMVLPGTDLGFDWFIRKGWMGILLFYTLAGFLLARPFVTGQIRFRFDDLRRYVLRRCWRVLPAFWAQLVILAAIAAAGGAWVSARDLVLQAGMLHNLIGTERPLLNLVWWTLPVEFDFYLLLPVFMWVLTRKPVRPGTAFVWLAAAIAIEWVWRHQVMAHYPPGVSDPKVYAAGQVFGTLSCFGAGVAAAVYAEARSARNLLPPSWIFFAGAALIAAAGYAIETVLKQYWDGHAVYYFAQPMAGIGAALVIYSAYRGSRVASLLFGNRYAVLAGLISYSLYLWHLPVLDLTRHLLDAYGYAGDRLLPYMLLAIPLSLATATASYWLVERPGLARMARVGHSIPPQASGQSAVGESTQQIPTFRR